MANCIIKDIKQEDLEKLEYLENYFNTRTRTKVLLKCLNICYNTFKESGKK